MTRMICVVVRSAASYNKQYGAGCCWKSLVTYNDLSSFAQKSSGLMLFHSKKPEMHCGVFVSTETWRRLDIVWAFLIITAPKMTIFQCRSALQLVSKLIVFMPMMAYLYERFLAPNHPGFLFPSVFIFISVTPAPVSVMVHLERNSRSTIFCPQSFLLSTIFCPLAFIR